MNCIQHFLSEENLKKHRQCCMAVNGRKAVKLSDEGSCIEFTNLKKPV